MTHQLSQPEIGFLIPSGSSISDVQYAAFRSQTAMGEFLLGNGYTAAQISGMTTNDKIYAIRSITSPAAPVAQPVVSDIMPLSASVGHTVVLGGNNLAGVTAVTCDAIAATIVTKTTTYLSFVVPVGATGAAPIVVTAPGGTANGAITVV